jgi:hypothetical protein
VSDNISEPGASDRNPPDADGEIDVQALRQKLHYMAADLQKIYDKVLALEERLDSLGGENISVERVPPPRLPRRLAAAHAKVKPPGDNDTSDPWIVKDGTADWDASDAIH